LIKNILLCETSSSKNLLIFNLWKNNESVHEWLLRKFSFQLRNWMPSADKVVTCY